MAKKKKKSAAMKKVGAARKKIAKKLIKAGVLKGSDAAFAAAFDASFKSKAQAAVAAQKAGVISRKGKAAKKSKSNGLKVKLVPKKGKK